MNILVLLYTYIKYFKVVILIVFLQVEEDQEAEEIDCAELLVGDDDGDDYNAVA